MGDERDGRRRRVADLDLVHGEGSEGHEGDGVPDAGGHRRGEDQSRHWAPRGRQRRSPNTSSPSFRRAAATRACARHERARQGHSRPVVLARARHGEARRGRSPRPRARPQRRGTRASRPRADRAGRGAADRRARPHRLGAGEAQGGTAADAARIAPRCRRTTRSRRRSRPTTRSSRPTSTTPACAPSAAKRSRWMKRFAPGTRCSSAASPRAGRPSTATSGSSSSPTMQRRSRSRSPTTACATRRCRRARATPARSC